MNLNECLENCINKLNESAENIFPNSKVRDSSGNLIKCYHGTPAKFDKFDTKFINTSSVYGAAFYFTDDFDYAKTHFKSQDSGYVKEVYLNIEHPLYIDFKILINKFGRDITKINEYLENKIKSLHQAGYDGLIVKNDRGHGNGTLYMVYNPNQIYVLNSTEYKSTRHSHMTGGFPSL